MEEHTYLMIMIITHSVKNTPSVHEAMGNYVLLSEC